MATTEEAARVLKSMKDEEWRTLAGLEKASSSSGTSDLGRLSRMSRLPIERVRFAVGELARKDLVARRGPGYSLTPRGVEVMALKDYVKKDLVYALGAIIAKGKESDVYEALTEEGVTLALKFYKIGRTSFTRVRKKRAPDTASMRSWITANYEAARREYHALKRLGGLSPSFPRVITYSRSTVLLEQLSGVRLSQRPYLEDPAEGFARVLAAARTAYLSAGLVNGDLSEYNILSDGAAFWLIDWPQAVKASHPNALDLLAHDIRAVANFFSRAYGVEADFEKAMLYVTGKADGLE